MIVWLAVQVLAIVASDTPWSAGWADPPRLVAVPLLASAQLLTAAWLFPWLLRPAGRTIGVIASTLPFFALAGRASGASPLALANCWAPLATCLIGMGVLAQAKQVDKSPVAAATMMGGWIVLAPILGYFSSEFSDGRFATTFGFLSPFDVLWGPNYLHFPPPKVWAFPLALCGIALFSAIFRR